MKIGVTSYSFEPYLASGKLTLYELPARAKAMGFEGIEFANLLYKAEMPDFDRLKSACGEAQIPVCGYCTTADYEQDIAEQTAFEMKEIDRAAMLGSPVVRTDVYHRYPRDPYSPRVIRELRALARYAAEKNIVLTVENHIGYFCRADQLEKLCQLVDDENFGLLADTGNFMAADEEPAFAIGRTAPFIRHVHCKDFHRKDGAAFYPGDGWFSTRGGDYIRCAIPGHGDANLHKCLNILRQFQYDGWLVYEFEGIEDTMQALEMGLKMIRRMVDNQ